jgi:hypothetical protein
MYSVTTAFFLAFLNLFTLVLSVPAPCSSNLGAPGGVYMCPEVNFQSGGTGQCTWHAPTLECFNFPDNIDQFPSSIGPDAGGYCLFYEYSNCAGVLAELPKLYEGKR